MKKHFLSLVIIFLAGTSYAQNRLKGAQAKNYNPLHQEQAMLSESHKIGLQGPQAKNRKVINANQVVVLSKPASLKGPQAKNHQMLRPTAPPNQTLNDLVRALPALLRGRPN